MNVQKLRVVIPVIVLVVAGVGYALNSGVGTLSAFGWQNVSLLCPLGALTSMIASKTLVPQALVSLLVFVVVVLLLGRAFCAWVCPVPFVQRLRTAFASKKVAKRDAAAEGGEGEGAEFELTGDELRALKGCSSQVGRERVDSRHFVLGGALLSTFVFGFPVFCLVCPIGLTFATVLLVFLLFTGGDVTWTVVVVPLLLLVEAVFFRKWCSKICPLSALMSLVAKANRTFRPHVNRGACVESVNGVSCGKCARACPVGVNPRHRERGAALSECSKCHACVEKCPAHAISLPFLPKKS